MEMCRACLSTGINMISMEESTIENFSQITNLNIKSSVHMSLYICEECHSAMMFCKKFRDKCIASDHTLNEILFTNNKIEQEFTREDNDYYVVIKKESGKGTEKDEISVNYYDSEIFDIENDVDDTFDGTIEIIVEPSTNTGSDDFNEKVDDPLLVTNIFCGLCSSKFHDKYMFIDHLATHRDDNNCKICLESSNSMSQLLAHRMHHLPDEQKGCLFCDKAFLNVASLQFHYMTVHKLDKSMFEELREYYLEKIMKFVIETSPVEEDTSKEKKTARNRRPRLKTNLNEFSEKKVKNNNLVVDTNKIVLSEIELKKLLEKTKEGFVPYYCGICPEELEDKRQLVKHLQSHKMDTHCSHCGLEFTSYQHLLGHRIAHVPDNQSSCLFCPIKFFNENELEQHYMNMHKLTEKVLPYICKCCLFSYETEKQLIQHMKYKHGAIKYVCDYCSKGFQQKSSLVGHMVSHLDRRLYKCHVCNYRAKLPGGIKEHVLRRHTAGRVYCRECRRAFPSVEMLDRHKPCAAGAGAGGDAMCPVCGLTLKMTSNLSRHLRTHTDVYSYKCGLCPAQYKSKSSFDAHVNKHYGTRKYHCEYCPMKFYSQPVLIKHRRVHTGERPYACKLCGKTFTGNHNLKVHMRVHGFQLINKKK